MCTRVRDQHRRYPILHASVSLLTVAYPIAAVN